MSLSPRACAFLKTSICVAALACMPLAATPAWADCDNPPAPEGRLIYNSSVKMAQVCDGTDWIGLGGGGTGGGGITTAGQDREIIYNDGGALTGNASLVFDKNTNSVGIGVAVPTQQLDVAGTMTSQGLLFKPIAGDPPIGGGGGGGGGFGGSLGNLSDVDTTAQANGRVLTYNSTTSMWEAAPISGGTLAGGTSGYLGVWAGANSLGTSGTAAGQHLFWDGTNHRLGVGTNAPWDSLSVNNNINLHDGGHKGIGLAGAYNVSGWQRQNSAAYQSVIGFNPAAGDLYFSVAGSDNANMAVSHLKMVVRASGNVGIGTTAPGALLEVDGGVILGDVDDSPTTADHVIIKSDGGTAFEGGMIFSNTNSLTAGKGIKFSNAYSAGTPEFRIGEVDFAAPNTFTRNYITLLTGNVGIGTTTPASQLHVSGASASGEALRISNPGGTEGGQISIMDGTGGGGWEIDNMGTGANAHLRIFRDKGVNNTSPTPFTITPSGNVGIGSTAPSSRLTIVNNTSAGGPVASFASYQILLYTSGSANASYGMGIESSNLWFNTGSGYKFYAGGAHVSTIASNGTYTAVSDERLKTDIKPLEGALGKVTAINGVTYHWKDKESRGGETQVGLIAQNVQQSYPELVLADDKGDLSVNYAGLVAPLVEAVKELKIQNEQLRADFEAYKAAHP